MRVGFNYPWTHDLYGLQIGPFTVSGDAAWDADRDPILGKQLPTFKPTQRFAAVAKNLRALSAIGVGVVRWFLIANGVNYGRAPTRQVVREGSDDRTVWSFSPPSTVDPRYAMHFKTLLELHRQEKMQMIPSLVDFALVGDSHGPDANGLAERGRADLIRDPRKRDHFLDGVLWKLLETSKPYRDVIYAWEVMNEPIWTLLPPIDPKLPIWDNAFGHVGPGRPLLRWPIIMQDQLRDFLAEAIVRIESLGFASTVGHRFFGDLASLPTGNRPQFHYYAKTRQVANLTFGDPPKLPTFTGNPPPFLGELASDQAPADQNAPWPDLAGKSDTTLERLKLLDSKGCPLAMLWPDRGGTADDALKLHPATIAQIKTFTGKP